MRPVVINLLSRDALNEDHFTESLHVMINSPRTESNENRGALARSDLNSTLILFSDHVYSYFFFLVCTTLRSTD